MHVRCLFCATVHVSQKPVRRQLNHRFKPPASSNRCVAPGTTSSLFLPCNRRCLPVQLQNFRVVAANDQQSRRLHSLQECSGKVGPAAARNHGRDDVRPFSGRDQRRRGARTCAKESERQRAGFACAVQPVAAPTSRSASRLMLKR